MEGHQKTIATATAVTGTAGCLGATTLMWVADHLGWSVSPIIYVTIGIISVGLILWSVWLWVRIVVSHFHAKGWAWKSLRVRENEAPFIIEFPARAERRDEINEFCRRVNLSAADTPLTDAVCQWAFVAKIKNISFSTAKSVRAEAQSVSYDRGAKPQRLAVVLGEWREIHRLQSVSFQFVELLMPQSGGLLSGGKLVDRHTLDVLRFQAMPGNFSPPVGAGVPTLTSGLRIQKPGPLSDTHLHIVVYAENLPPVYARFTISGEEFPIVRLAYQGLGEPPPVKVVPVVALPSPTQPSTPEER